MSKRSLLSFRVRSLPLAWFLLAAGISPSTFAGGGLYGLVMRQVPNTTRAAGPAANTRLTLTCPGQPGSAGLPQTFATNDAGSFVIRPPILKGRCELRGPGGKPVEVFVSDSSLKYEFLLDKDANLLVRP